MTSLERSIAFFQNHLSKGVGQLLRSLPPQQMTSLSSRVKTPPLQMCSLSSPVKTGARYFSGCGGPAVVPGEPCPCPGIPPSLVCHTLPSVDPPHPAQSSAVLTAYGLAPVLPLITCI